MKGLTSKINVGERHGVNINKAILKCHLVLFKHALSSQRHSRVTSKQKQKNVVLGRKGQERKRRGVAVETWMYKFVRERKELGRRRE